MKRLLQRLREYLAWEKHCSWCKTVVTPRRLKWAKPIVTHGICQHCAGEHLALIHGKRKAGADEHPPGLQVYVVNGEAE